MGNIGLTTRSFLRGGIRRFWIASRRYVRWPETYLRPDTQMLLQAPSVEEPGEWIGPIQVTSAQAAFTETMELTKAGPLWKQKVVGFVPGIGSQHHINLANLVHDQFAVIVQPRNTNVFFMPGGPNSWFRLVPDFTTGEGKGNPPGTTLVLECSAAHRSLLLAGFSGGNGSTDWGSCGTDAGTGGSTFLGLRTFLYMVNTDDVDNKQTYLLLPDLAGTTMEGVERSGMENLQILTDGSAPAYTYQVAWDSAAARLDVHPDRPIAPGENFFFLFR